MLDLKAKLAAAGLVTKEQIAAVERPRPSHGGGGSINKNNRKENPAKRPPPARSAPARPPAPPKSASGLDLVGLKKAGKSEVYEATRRLVDRARLDPLGGLPSERAEAFHFTTEKGALSRLTLEPEITAQLVAGDAAIVAYMSHHGLAHCVVPRPVAADLAELMPLWLRVCKDHPAAGQLAPPPPPREDRGAKPPEVD